MKEIAAWIMLALVALVPAFLAGWYDPRSRRRRERARRTREAARERNDPDKPPGMP